MHTVKQILDENEEILWEGKPQLLPFVLNGGSILVALFGTFWSLFLIPLIGIMGPFALLVPHTYIGPLLIFGPTLYRIFVYSKVNYVATNKRVIIEGGLVGRDLKSIDYDQVTDISVNADLFDKLFGKNSGSIIVTTASSPGTANNGPVPSSNEMDSINDPYTVFKKLKEISHAVKTDIAFPNANRPVENPGYQSKLTSNPFKPTES